MRQIQVFLTFIAISLLITTINAGYIEIEGLPGQGEYQSLLKFKKSIQDSLQHIDELQFVFRAESKHQADIKFDDLNNKNRFSMPKTKPFDTLYQDKDKKVESEADFKFELHETGKNGFNFQIIRSSTNEIVFSGDNEMVFSENYLKFSSKIPSNFIFGIGERNNRNFRLKNGLYTLNAIDQLHQIDEGIQGGQSVYSSHPVYLVREASGNYNVVFYKNPTPSDCIIETNKITFKSVGGIIHFKIFFGDHNPETAIRYFHEYLGGGHALPPFWAFGFHQSRWGYRNQHMIFDTIEKHKQNNIPLDTIWSDIDYMNDKQTFTVNSVDFPESFFDKLHNELKINYIPIVDCGVGAKDYNKGNLALKKGIEMDIFLRSPFTGKRYKGKVWPGDSFFPDFLHPNISEYWSFMFQDFYNKTHFNGIWVDMNEPTNFDDCMFPQNSNHECNWIDDNPYNDYKEEFIKPKFNLPFQPGNQNLQKMTLPYNLIHYGNYTHKDVHNLYGFMDTYHTFNALRSVNKVYPFIITRSSFTGSGRFTFKWTGDNDSNYDFLQISIPSILNYNIFGIPFVGADICGFLEHTQDQLCQRWIQLGALYPFARNHNNDQARPQEFYNLSPEVTKTASKNLKLRYSLLKHYFMLFVRTNHKGTIFRPVFFEFPYDGECFQDRVLNQQFLLGNELMATPVVEYDKTTTSAYFPEGSWFDLLSGYKMIESKKGKFKDVYNTLTDYVPIFLRSGKLVGMQDSKNVLKIADLNNEFNIICSLKQQNSTDQYSCTGNLLNVSNQSDEKEIHDECDQEVNAQSNCLLQVNIDLRVKDKILSFSVSSYQDALWKPLEDSKFKLKDISIRSIIMYNFPISEVSQDQLKIMKADGSVLEKGASINKYNYVYNKYIQFEKDQIVLSQISKFTIKL
ncbi:glycoside hydrolase family 31 protein (macronuclear) [Tetrahymena thermophila SB210]|uniref:Glycoside hydrolase family 31 protein n=1 Tax=Tetrahymena thermophila (strain SB210) TaxID=312017 RepID=W7XEN5_TETTS|nr:glycoside hydrolase family 31 protein [Tetrahymena thermophila SB210]EWS76217.1 glycoside hydrolase family 31 protein [Tetrahymena thermophila SB210]|eukprot:XP_012651264.1 glycoside hydrolase family 31 protein [Tetrahymena thermophila SB210]